MPSTFNISTCFDFVWVVRWRVKFREGTLSYSGILSLLLIINIFYLILSNWQFIKFMLVLDAQIEVREGTFRWLSSAQKNYRHPQEPNYLWLNEPTILRTCVCGTKSRCLDPQNPLHQRCLWEKKLVECLFPKSPANRRLTNNFLLLAKSSNIFIFLLTTSNFVDLLLQQLKAHFCEERKTFIVGSFANVNTQTSVDSTMHGTQLKQSDIWPH